MAFETVENSGSFVSNAEMQPNVSKTESELDLLPKSKKKKGKKQKKNKPKKAMTPFMVFSKETRKVLVAENPNLTFSEIGKELGARWRALSEADKQIFVFKANQDYQRFLDETEQLEAQNPGRKRKTVEQKNQTKKKKSISAYLYFCNAHREQVKACHPDMKMVEIQRLLAEKWMNSPQTVKIPYEKQAEADREKYNADIQIVETFESMIDPENMKQETSIFEFPLVHQSSGNDFSNFEVNPSEKVNSYGHPEEHSKLDDITGTVFQSFGFQDSLKSDLKFPMAETDRFEIA